MAKRLCKLHHRDITANLGTIHTLVRVPRFLCRSCARVAAKKSCLCKPDAIPFSSQMSEHSTGGTLLSESLSGKKSLKKLGKEAKKRKKIEKKLQKTIRKQNKLKLRQEKLEQKLLKADTVIRS